MKNKKLKWKLEYYGYSAFILGIIFLCLNSFSIAFVFVALSVFFAGAVFNTVISIKNYKKEVKSIQDTVNNAMIENEDHKQEVVVDEKTLRDIKLYKAGLKSTIITYIAVGVLSIMFFVRLLTIL